MLGVLPGLIGLVQATEAVKILLDRGRLLVGRLLLYDALAMKFREFPLQQDPHCPLCGPQPKIEGLVDYEAFCSGKH